MDENDDKLLAAYDLTAWDAPPAPAGMVDRIVERARMPAAPSMKAAWKWKRAVVIVGSATVALAAVAALVVFGTERAPQNGGGLVRATNAQRLDIGPSFATLDAGTELHWQRRGTHVDVVQLKGGAVWNVSAKDTLVIETGSPGATVASVEATGASLRTEVQMLNRTDARVIGLGSAVAALVSITTVVVYEGHVKATSNGQVVNIQSGSTAQFPPSAPGNQPPESQYAVGAGPGTCDTTLLGKAADADHAQGNYVDALIELKLSYACKASADTAARISIEACHANDRPTLDQFYPLSERSMGGVIYSECKAAGFDTDALYESKDKTACDEKTPRQKGEDFLNNGMDTAALASFEQSLECKDDTQVVKMAYIAACRLKSKDKAVSYFKRLGSQGSLVQVCMRWGIDPANAPPSPVTGPNDATCDEVSCVLDNYKGACCTPFKLVHDSQNIPLMIEGAKRRDRELQQKKLEQQNQATCDEVSCVLNNNAGACCAKYKKTAATPPEPTCDAAGARSKGEKFLNDGQDTQALSLFELSLKCKPDTQVMKMAYIATCRLKNATKAKAYYAQLGAQPSLIQVCKRFGIDPSQ
ncbi:MAG TPA: hypothetical protein VGM90_39970 [Kofleriaceae bacterium]